ncbi:hypothetical protein CJ030_MR6G024802 [Morella rubra]|uniref:WLM domain-containing protein n=1 Tax=Morella rubra TaxID=262757 RepID=A0A6A1V9C0_9ROSI|nr:hypothetical protein CJ030_MR6G024802 [Morella rubra]
MEMSSGTTLKELGLKLQELTGVKADTMRLIVPRSSEKTSKLLSPFSDEQAFLSLEETSITKGKSIRMMGVPESEVNEILENAKANLRIAGFEEEEKRLRQRMSDRPHASLKLPQGPYVFCDFRTLEIPGVELNPPASEALKRMHMLAADPGIVAIMNKHHWRVGIMTEMAPIGYVGISPKCVLGFNTNQGEEISLRLRTDDLKGFRKYESIKKTLLHELAHMVYSEHDANFYALDKQLNKEAASLDWTRSRGHTLNGVQYSEHYEENFFNRDGSNSSLKLGGSISDQLASARESSIAAAYRRLANASVNSLGGSAANEEPDPDDSGFNTDEEPASMDSIEEEDLHTQSPKEAERNPVYEPFPNDRSGDQNKLEPNPDDPQQVETSESDFYSGFTGSITVSGEDFSNSGTTQPLLPSETNRKLGTANLWEEPDPDESKGMEILNGRTKTRKNIEEPDPDDSHANGVMQTQPDPDANLGNPLGVPRMQNFEPDPEDQELQRIQDPVTVVCGRLQKAIETLQVEVAPTEATAVLQTLFKIIRNVIEHPTELKYRRLRKTNPLIQRNVANYQAAMEILSLVGFNEDVLLDEIGKAESYLVLKRNDPGLLWLAKSSLETCIAY